jgi:hypothetical protein
MSGNPPIRYGRGHYGNVILRSWFGSAQVEVVQADPSTLISSALLNEIRRGEANPSVTVDGSVLTIRGSNRTVIYRIVEHLPHLNAYLLEWPD